MRHRRSIAPLVVALVIALGGHLTTVIAQDATPTASLSGKAMFRANPARTGEFPYAVPHTAPTERLRIPLLPNPDPAGPPNAPNSPVVADGVIFVSDRDNFHAFDFATGHERWRIEHQTSSFSTPAVAGGIVVIGTGGQGLVAFDEATGTELWRFESGGPSVQGLPPDAFDSSPTIVGGVVYEGKGPQGWLYALDLLTGHLRWRYDPHGATGSFPAVLGGAVFVATDGTMQVAPSTQSLSAIIAVDADTGAQRWRTELDVDEIVYSGPAVVNGTVYVGVMNSVADEGFVLALDATSGTERWRAPADAPMGAGSIAVGGGLVIVPGGGAGTVLAHDAATGQDAWVWPGTDPVFGSPVIAGDTLLFFGNARVLHALDLTTGADRWEVDTGGTSGGLALGSPWVTADGQICVRAEGAVIVLA